MYEATTTCQQKEERQLQRRNQQREKQQRESQQQKSEKLLEGNNHPNLVRV